MICGILFALAYATTLFNYYEKNCCIGLDLYILKPNFDALAVKNILLDDITCW